MRNKIIIFIILTALFANAQINKFGAPLITYYPAKQYNAESQNWASVKDNRDVMFFGNTGILRYDGNKWEKYNVNNESIVYSLAVDSNNIVYAGAVSEFGCLLPTKDGDLKYNILSNQLDSAIKFSDVRKIYVDNGNIYFCTWNYIFIYSNLKHKKTIKLPKGSFLSFVVNNNIYITHYSLGLLKYKEDSIIQVKGSENFIEKSIYGIIPFNNNKLLVVTGQKGVYIFNKEQGTVEPFLSDTAKLIISKGILYNVTKLNNDNYAFATIYAGLIVTDNNGNIIYHLDKNNGLADNIVTNVFQSNDGPLWLTLNEGIAKIDINIPLNYFDLSKNIDGTLNDMIFYKNTLFIATDAGVYYISNKNLYPELKKTTINEQTWAFQEFSKKNKDVLLISTNHGLYELSDTNNIKDIESQIKNIEVKPGVIRSEYIYKLKNKPVILLCNKIGVKVLELIDEDWNISTKYDLNIKVKNITENNKGSIWVASENSGIYRIEYADSLKITENYNKDNGLLSLTKLSITLFNNILYCNTKEGLFKIDEKTKKVVRAKLNGKYITDRVKEFKIFDSNNYILITKKDNNKINIDNNNKDNYDKYLYVDTEKNILDSITFNSLSKSKINPFFTEIAKYKVFVGIGNQIYFIDKTRKISYIKPPKVIFRKISAKDSIIFKGIFIKKNKNKALNLNNIISSVFTNENKLELDYKNNELTFEFSTPYYNHAKELEYSYFMEGDDDEWSSWSKKNYDNEKLDEGDYTLKVKVRNQYGIESDIAIYKFSIKAPWYRTILAYIIYAILIIGFIVLIVYLNNRRLLKDKARLEEIVKQRTAEVVAQKEEIEVQKEEIESQRDLVLDQKNKIEIIHQEITDSIHYAERIQRAILPAEEHVNKAVPEHFILFKPKDIVSGDYYWATVLENKNKNKKDFVGKLVITAADCTGHGVPGAFMSMLGVSFLNEIVNEKEIDQSNLILNMMRENVITSLQQTGAEGEQKDGMDMALMVIDIENDKVQFSGANNPLYVIRKKSMPELKVLTPDTEIRINEIDESDYILYEIKGDKMPIAIHVLMDDFRLNEIEVLSGDTLYMFSDGYADQFGGKKGKKFKYKPFKKIFLTNQHLSMHEQKEVLNKEIEAWKAFTNPVTNTHFEQIDDIVVIGIKIP